MPTATLVPTSLTDAYSNVAAGAYTDVDNTIASASGTTLDTVTNAFSGGTGASYAFSFGLSDLPAEADSINTVKFRVRCRVTGTFNDPPDLNAWKLDVSGTNAPTTVATYNQDNIGGGFITRGASSPVTSSALVSEVNGWSVRVYQTAFYQISTADDLNLEIDEIEIEVDYNAAPPDPPSPPPTGGGGGYVVIPTTDTSIYGLCVARVRDFVVLGGLDTDRYAIRWSAIGDPTDWPTPATDDARTKQSGSQSFPTEYGWVTAVAGNDFYGYVFMERAIAKMTYVGGDVVFTFDIFEEDRGCVRQGRIVQVDDKVFFQSNRGFHMIENDQIADIGYGIVDDSFN